MSPDTNGFGDDSTDFEEGDPRTGFEQTVRQERRRQQLRQAALQDHSFLDEDDVEIRTEDGDFVAEFTPEAEQEIVAHDVAESFDEEFEFVDITADDVEQVDDGFRITEDAEREIVADVVDEELSDRDVTAEDFERTDDGLRFSDEFQEAGAEAGETVGDSDVDVPDIDISRDADGEVEVSGTSVSGVSDSGEGSGSSVDDLLGEDFALSRDADGDPGLRLRRGDRTTEGTTFQLSKEGVFRVSDDGVEQLAGTDEDAAPEAETPLEVGADKLRRNFGRAAGFAGSLQEIRQEIEEEHGVDVDHGDLAIGPGQELNIGQDLRADIATQQFDEALDSDISRGDIVETDDGFELEDERRRELFATEQDERFAGARESETDVVDGDTVAREAGAGEVVQRPDVDITEDDVELTADGPRLDAETRAEVARQELDARTRFDIDAEDIEVTEGSVGLRDEFERDVAAERLDEETRVAVTSDRVVRTGDGFALDEETRELETRAQLADEIEAATLADIQIDDGAVEFSDRLQDEMQQQQLEDAGDQIEQQIAVDQLTDGLSPERATAIEQQARSGDLDLSERAPVDISTDDLVVTDENGRQQIELSGDAEQRLVGRLVEEDTGMVEGQDFEIQDPISDRAFREVDADAPLRVTLLDRPTEIAARDFSDIDGPAIGQLDDEDIERIEGVQQRQSGTVAPRVSERDVDTPVVDALADAEDSLPDTVTSGLGPISSQAISSLRLETLRAEVLGPVADRASPIVQASEDARDFTVERVTEPTAEFVEDLSPGVLGDLTGPFLGTGGRVATDVTVGLPATVSDFASGARTAEDFVVEEISTEGVVRGTESIVGTTGEVTREAQVAAVGQFRDEPIRTTSAFAGGAVVSVAVPTAAGRGIGAAGRAARDKVRTVGATRVDVEDMTQRQVLDVIEEGGKDFPPAQNPQLFRSDPPAAVRSQARDMTPTKLAMQFEDAGIEGPTLFKALDVEPDGPGPAGFRTQPGDFESPGAFVGPELSPVFLRTASRDPEFSLRPGLPDIRSGSPTAVAIRTDVERPDAKTMDDFRAEMLDRAGETTARTKPERAVNVGEIEAIIPPEAAFADVGTGLVRDTLRRAGVGADFAVEIGGRTVPIRTVAPESELSAGRGPSVRALLRDDRAQAGVGARRGTRVRRDLDEVVTLRRPVDRPLPIVASPFTRDDSDIDTEMVISDSLVDSEDIDTSATTPVGGASMTSAAASDVSASSAISESVRTSTISSTAADSVADSQFASDIVPSGSMSPTSPAQTDTPAITDIPGTPTGPGTRAQPTTPTGKIRPPASLRLQTDDRQPGRIELGSDFAREFEEPVATPESVLTAEGPSELDFSAPAERIIDDDLSPKVVALEGDIEEDLL